MSKFVTNTVSWYSIYLNSTLLIFVLYIKIISPQSSIKVHYLKQMVLRILCSLVINHHPLDKNDLEGNWSYKPQLAYFS